LFRAPVVLVEYWDFYVCFEYAVDLLLAYFVHFEYKGTVYNKKAFISNILPKIEKTEQYKKSKQKKHPKNLITIIKAPPASPSPTLSNYLQPPITKIILNKYFFNNFHIHSINYLLYLYNFFNFYLLALFLLHGYSRIRVVIFCIIGFWGWRKRCVGSRGEWDLGLFCFGEVIHI
jgi:hypothetical protein